MPAPRHPAAPAALLPDLDGYVLEEDLALTLTGTSTAVYSRDRAYRYLLARTWGGGPLIAWVMLNPSRGGAVSSDPTLIRCQNFARRWRFGGMTVVNLFALRSPDPAVLTAHPDPAGAGNDTFIRDAAVAAAVTVAAWGTLGSLAGRAAEVTRALAGAGIRLRCLGRTKDGSPRHPLYVHASTPLQLYEDTGVPGGIPVRAARGGQRPRAGEPATGPARRLTIGYRAGDNAVLTGPSTLISGAATSPRDADGPR